MQTPITIIVSGAPGTGKSTVQALAPYYFRERLGAIAALGTDEFYQFLDPRWASSDRRLWHMAVGSCLAVAKYLFQQGVQVVLIASNGLYTNEDVEPVLAALQPIGAVHHFTLDARLDVVVERVRKRGDLGQHPPEWLESWLDHIRPHYAGWTHVIDTSELTPEQILERIHQSVL